MQLSQPDHVFRASPGSFSSAATCQRNCCVENLKYEICKVYNVVRMRKKSFGCFDCPWNKKFLALHQSSNGVIIYFYGLPKSLHHGKIGSSHDKIYVLLRFFLGRSNANKVLFPVKYKHYMIRRTFWKKICIQFLIWQIYSLLTILPFTLRRKKYFK